MKVLYSLAQRDPGDWLAVDARAIRAMGKPSSAPLRGERGDTSNDSGYISNLMVQGVMFNGLDHVAPVPVVINGEDGVKITGWNDDPNDPNQNGRVARIWQFLPLAPDPTFGSGNRERLLESIRNEPGITEQRRAEVLAWHNDPAHFPLNTRQSQVVYAEGDRYDRLLAEGSPVRPWAEFEGLVLPTVDPRDTFHGIWVPDEHWERQVEARTPIGWMHWNEHLPESECEWERDEIRHNGRARELRTPRRVLKCQRDQGRYRQAEHTITYYQRDTNRAVGFIVSTHEDALELATATSGTEAVTTNSSTVQCWTFTAAANEPNSTNWPSGKFNKQLNCTAASAGISYGFEGNGTTVRSSSQISADLASVVESFLDSGGGGEFTGTGLKLSVVDTTDFAAGLASAVYSTSVRATGTSHGDAITLTLNTPDSYADGPWSAGATQITAAITGTGSETGAVIVRKIITAAL